MIAISVVVPIYNAEEHLAKCIESVLSQRFSDFEIILLDDGSTDKSAEIAYKYAENDDRIKVISNSNRGVSFTRNQGIKLSKGKYLLFLDADDWIDREMLGDMHLAAETYQAQVVQCGYCKVNAKTNIVSEPVLPEFSEGRVYSPDELIKIQPHAHTSKIYCFSWRFLFSKEHLMDNNISFNEEISIGEDALLNFHAILSAQRICFVRKGYYYYFRHEKSTMLSRYKPTLERSSCLQYESKKQLFHKHGWDSNREFMRDWSRFNITVLLRRLLINLFNGPEEDIKPGIKRILNSSLIKDSFHSISLMDLFSADKKGVYTFIFALFAKMRMASLMYYMTKKKCIPVF